MGDAVARESDAAAAAGELPLLGRSSELADLRAALEESASGRGALVLLAGEPGIGKTRLATEIARRAHDENAIVLYGRSDAESLVPYQPFIAAIGHYVNHRARLDLPPELTL